MYKKLSVILFFLFFSLVACKKSLTPEKYIQWVNAESNGLIVKQGNDNYEVSIQYRPQAYMALLETGARPTSDQFKESIDKYSSSGYFAMKIKKLKGNGDALQSGDGQYYDRLKYFSDDIKSDLYLLAGEDTIPCMLHHLERTYKLSPYTNILLAFEVGENTLKENKKLFFVYDDKALGLGKQTFEISASAIENTPKIKFR